MILRIPACLFTVLLLSGCGEADKRSEPPTVDSPVNPIGLSDWIGIYTSPSEIKGFSHTVLAIDNRDSGVRAMRVFRSDIEMSELIDPGDRDGACIIEGDQIYISEGWGLKRGDEVMVYGALERYTRVEINERVVLMRDGAYSAYKKEGKLYDYGVLIKVGDDPSNKGGVSWKGAAHESIKVLYADPTKPWKDSFVHGPNER